MKNFLLLIFLIFFCNRIVAQDPAYFSYSIENGAPSNEIYCILQDKQGYIWIGCDAGVYRFNGVTYEHFSSSELNSQSATGLCQSPGGRIYGYNFNKQIFYIEGGILRTIDNWNFPVNGIASVGNGTIWISSSEGVFELNEKSLKWKLVNSSLHSSNGSKVFTNNIRSDSEGRIYYHNYEKIIEWKDGNVNSHFIDKKYKETPLIISRSVSNPWLFDILGAAVFQKTKNGWSEYKNPKLIEILKGRKLTSVVETNQGNIWINTYSGLVHFNKFNGKVELLYSDIAFSDCLKDAEGNYWFSTLHNGIFRIPQFDVRVWNVESGAFTYDPFSHIATDGEFIYFAGTTGIIRELSAAGDRLKNYEHKPNSDLGMFYFDALDQCIYFNKMNQIFRLKDGRIDEVNSQARSIKSMLHIKNDYFLLSSQGLFCVNSITDPLDGTNLIVEDWCRDIESSPFSGSKFVAANGGLYELQFENGKWKNKSILLKNQQIISITVDQKKQIVYILSFEGLIYSIDKNRKITEFKKLDSSIKAVELDFHKGKIYLATNKGIMGLDIENGSSFQLGFYEGLSSNNVRALTFTDKYCWAATGKGIQRIPLNLFRTKKGSAKIIFREFRLNNNPKGFKAIKEMRYDDELTIVADGISFFSNGNFDFAYRIIGYNENWIKVPGSAGKIIIPQLPTGNITIELKMIDHNGMSSINSLKFELRVLPPFWQRWWFYLLLAVSVGLSAYAIFKRRESILQKKQQVELKNLRLENELRLTQQNALKAQMNPHFLFNVLNSIKGFIYENDKKNAAKYLSDFSSLVRKILEMSSLPVVTLEKELETLKLYIDLEAMLLQMDFSYEIVIDENVDESAINIPALLIQPYVENAFKHGLRHKSGEKKLNISINYLESEELLLITITDNGIGRKAADEINKKTQAEHQSFASHAMERRLDLLNHEKEGIVGVEIVDNFNLNGEPEGTIVYIRIHV